MKIHFRTFVSFSFVLNLINVVYIYLLRYWNWSARRGWDRVNIKRSHYLNLVSFIFMSSISRCDFFGLRKQSFVYLLLFCYFFIPTFCYLWYMLDCIFVCVSWKTLVFFMWEFILILIKIQLLVSFFDFLDLVKFFLIIMLSVFYLVL